MTDQAKKSRNVWTIEGLGANGPDPELEEKLMLFGQFIGDWDIIEARIRQPDGTEAKHQGQIHFGWILGGRATQDVWMTYREKTHELIPVGTTIRFYDPRLEAWRVIWICPIEGVVQTFIARKVDEEIVLEGKTKEGYPERWIFSDITPQSFRWRSVQTQDNGKTWQLTEEMQVRKRDENH